MSRSPPFKRNRLTKLQRRAFRTESDRTKSKLGDQVEVPAGWVADSGLSLLAAGVDQTIKSGHSPELYVRTGTNILSGSSEYKSTWYLIPEEELKIEPQPPRPIANGITGLKQLMSVFGQMPSGNAMRNSVAVALLPNIYVLGGGYLLRPGPSAQVFSYNMNYPDKGWERRPNMISPRCSPSAVALDGKIYVFGGSTTVDRGSSTLPSAEVYDPESDRWEALHGGESYKYTMGHHHPSLGHALFMDQYLNKHLLVRLTNTFYTYDMSADSFTVREHVPFKYAVGNGAVVDGILYTYESMKNCIVAYDVKKSRWFREPVRGLDQGTVLPDGNGGVSPFLSDIGNGRLCMTYDYSLHDADHICRNLLLTCSVVRVSRSTSPSNSGEATLLASLESFKRYIIPGKEIQDCLVL